jgi:hypothetical protein
MLFPTVPSRILVTGITIIGTRAAAADLVSNETIIPPPQPNPFILLTDQHNFRSW